VCFAQYGNVYNSHQAAHPDPQTFDSKEDIHVRDTTAGAGIAFGMFRTEAAVRKLREKFLAATTAKAKDAIEKECSMHLSIPSGLSGLFGCDHELGGLFQALTFEGMHNFWSKGVYVDAIELALSWLGEKGGPAWKGRVLTHANDVLKTIHKQQPGFRLPCQGEYFGTGSSASSSTFTANLQAREHRAASRVVVLALHLACRAVGPRSGANEKAFFRDFGKVLAALSELVSTIFATYRRGRTEGFFESEIDSLVNRWDAARSGFLKAIGASRPTSTRKWHKTALLRGTLINKAANLMELDGGVWEHTHTTTSKQPAGRARSFGGHIREQLTLRHREFAGLGELLDVYDEVCAARGEGPAARAERESVLQKVRRHKVIVPGSGRTTVAKCQLGCPGAVSALEEAFAGHPEAMEAFRRCCDDPENHSPQDPDLTSASANSRFLWGPGDEARIWIYKSCGFMAKLENHEWEPQLFRANGKFWNRPVYSDVVVTGADGEDDRYEEDDVATEEADDSADWYIRVLAIVAFRQDEANHLRLFYFGRYYVRPCDPKRAAEPRAVIAANRPAGCEFTEHLVWDESATTGGAEYVMLPVSSILRVIKVVSIPTSQAGSGSATLAGGSDSYSMYKCG
jgi:hypothetical protein